VVADGRPGILRYRCNGQQAPGDAPKCHQTVAAPAVDSEVWRAVKTVLLRAAKQQAPLRRIYAGLRAQEGDLGDPAAERLLNERIAHASARIVRATERFVDGDIERDAYDALCAKARREIADDKGSLDQLLDRRQHAPPVLPEWDDLSDLFLLTEELLDSLDVAQKRILVSRLITSVTAQRIRQGHYAVNPDWNPLGQFLDTRERARVA